MIRNILFVLVLCALTKKIPASMTHRSRRDAETCGVPKIPQGLIVRGQNFPRGQFPWIVALFKTRSSPPAFFCAGTLISKTFVISAAHCILQKYQTDSEKLLPRQIRALFGAHNLKNSLESGTFVLSPKEVHLHENWDPETTQYDSDLALLEFEAGSISFNNFVQPICLWNSENDPAVTKGVVTGWGKGEDETKDHEDIPKMVKAIIQTNEDCFFTEGQRDHIDLSSKRTFCAGLRNGSGICEGDSGGGLFIKVNGVRYLRGIVSSSSVSAGGDCDVSINAIYTNVLMFRGWINGKTGLGTAVDLIEETTTGIASAAKKVFCTFTTVNGFTTCNMNQAINGEDFVLGSPRNTSVGWFEAYENQHLKFLPRGIGEKFPNLKTFRVTSCGLTIVRDFYFKNMKKLEKLELYWNQIKTIEPKSFDDLVNLSSLRLWENQIEIIDEKLFVKMVNVDRIYLSSNKIKSLSPKTFKIPGNRKLKIVDLKNNVCYDQAYGGYELPLSQLESDLRTNGCSKGELAPFFKLAGLI